MTRWWFSHDRPVNPFGVRVRASTTRVATLFHRLVAPEMEGKCFNYVGEGSRKSAPLTPSGSSTGKPEVLEDLRAYIDRKSVV